MQKIIVGVLAYLMITGCGIGVCPIRSTTGYCISNGYESGSALGPFGIVDTSFNGTGSITTNILNTDIATGVFLLAGDKFLVTGQSNNDFALVRYHYDGSVDTTFGTAGIISQNISGNDSVSAAVMQADGKVILAGAATFGTRDLTIARFLATGELDTTFGTGGISSYSLSAGNDNATDLIIQPDNKIVVVGQGGGDFSVLRYQSDGALDTTFATGGLATTPILAGVDAAEAVTLQSDNKIIVGGTAHNGANTDFALARYHTNGSLDTTFGTSGIVTTDILNTDTLAALTMQPDGKILAGGFNSSINNTLIRYHSNGSLDTTFGTNGISSVNFGGANESINDIILQSDGKIIAAGYMRLVGNTNFNIIRYLSNGSVDTSFGSSGIVYTDFAGLADMATKVVLSVDNKITAVGHVNNTTDFGIARYR